ncbi:ABC transporter ATP-binding protein [Proteiniborus sp. DW1]|uniref:ABC transporter ATP-binding protein n=1 Tax=Proteiniborus sp. DW1 TaxID=1889883 RepID=UPI001FA84B21|nr:ABC transporter ATP-binding protein [Proteiniborus sp. DW1]
MTKKYMRGSTSFSAVDNVSLSIDKEEFVSIIGRSGSGKSTLLNMIAGLIKPTSGSINVDGQDILALSDKSISLYRNSKIGYVPQGNTALGNLTVLDNVRLPFYLYKNEGDPTSKALSLLEQLGISHLSEMFPKHLSGGELRRVFIARALINDPVMLIADEPTSDLDVKTTIEIMELFSEIAKKGVSILLVTHELDTIKYGNSVYIMEEGKLTRGDSALLASNF